MPETKRPLRVALFTDTYTPQINGVVTSVVNLKRGLEEMGHTVTVVAPKHPAQKPEQGVIRIRSTTYRPQPEQRYAFPPSLRKILEFRRRKFDIIHTHGLVMPVIGLGIGRLLGVPVVMTYHTRIRDYVHYAPFYATMSWLLNDKRWYVRGSRTRTRVSRSLVSGFEHRTQALAARVDEWLCNRNLEIVSPAAPMADELVQMGVQSPISVVPNGINLEILQQPRPDPYPKHGVPNGVKRLVHVSRIGKEKSIDALLERFGLVHSAMPDTHLIVVGDGPERQALERLCKKLGLENAVTFTGYVANTEVGAYYQHADLFVFASISETQGMVALEAAACGCPVVARAEMGIITCVIDGQTGYLVDTHDVAGYAARVLELLRDEDKRQAFSRAAKAFALVEGSHHTMTTRILEVYARAIGTSKRWLDLSLPDALETALSAENPVL
jgi:1,2-diacylglycerol 3-alpha-glucosyltransferase